MSEADANAPPDRLVPVSLLPEDAVWPGRPCRVCGKPTVRGRYKLENGLLRRVKGSGPDSLDPRKVFDPTGELRLRSDDG